MEDHKQIQVQSNAVEGIDFNKLKIAVRNNWMWIVIIFFVFNFTAYLFNRYTKNLYQSSSDLKLDVKQEATEFGIKSAIEDQNLNLISGEIEIIQSRLFLSRVLDSTKLDISYYSIGRVLNEELYQSLPFFVSYNSNPRSLLNIPLYFEEERNNGFTLTIGNNGEEVKGTYNTPVIARGVTLTIVKNKNFSKGDEVGYFFIINSRDLLLDYLLTNLTAEPLNFNANTIRISFKDHNPYKAQNILHKIDTLYLQYSNEQKNLANKQKIDWVSNELVAIETKMEDYENYFENFTLQNKTNNLDDDLKKTVLAINRIDSQRFELSQKSNELDQLLTNLEKENFIISLSQQQALPASVSRNMETLEQLYLEMNKLKLSHSEITFAFRQKQQEVDALREKIISQLSELKNATVKNLEDANKRKQRLESEFAGIPDKSTQFSKNLRFYKLYEQFYLSLMQSKSEFEIAQAGSIQDFKILSPATFPSAPIFPNKLMIGGIGFVLSIVANLIFIGLLYLLNNRISGVSEIERITNVPVLGVVPSSRYATDIGLHVIDHPKSMVSESIKTLRTNLDFFKVNSNKKIIAVSSTVSGEGKSFIAMNLGAVMAVSSKKVILLDLDMRKPKINLPTEIGDKSKGMSTVLIGKDSWQECLARTGLTNFDYIPSGPHPPNPSELLLNGEFSGLLEELKKTYDYIILDTPPVGLVTDGIMAMKQADISIYIFRADYSRKTFVYNLQRIININKFSNITTVLNALPSTGEQRYGYGYYEEPQNKNWFQKFIKA
ncbi:polysaccharide biosynthesis tyrosine autokinase [Chryseolinea sp. H1M3-3]|uniref:GumC family protein n=1 Tax=Chryseolinea sp. H1M3-3 TaxID=3034144 RepID=UPI0023EB153F|nr:polysaccharide biosynthesis tyrosine autokinase [Chryseolinea sp. H1M3-3]